MIQTNKIEVGNRTYAVIAAGIFLFIAVLHGLRAYYGWDLVLHVWIIPIWFSWLVALVGFVMSITAIRKLR